MRNVPRFFILNKKSDFLRGCGGEVHGDTLKANGLYFSELFDSGERETRWYKLETEFSLPVNCSVQVSFYSSESEELDVGGRNVNITELLRSSEKPDEKLRLLSPLLRFTGPLSKELLLTRIRARYLFFVIHAVCPDGECPEIRLMRLMFDPYMWTNFLPELYRGDDSFLERYLAIFQSLFEHTESDIDCAAEYYSQDCADGDFLRWICGCFGIKTVGLWNEEQLRYILKNAPRIFGRVGTREILAELCGLYLGCEADIAEYYRSEDGSFVNRYSIPKERLFTSPYEFALILPCGPLSEEKYSGLLRIVDDFKPAYMTANIIIIPREGTQGADGEIILGDGITLV